MSKIFFREIEKLLDFSDGSSQKKYYETVSVNRETVSINMIQLYIKININRKIENIMINSGTTENFIIKKYTENKKHSI